MGSKVGSATSYTNFVQLGDDAGFSGWQTTVIPVPYLASGTLTKVAGRTDYGTFTGTLYFVPGDTGVQSVISMFVARTTASFQLQLPDDPTTPANGSTHVFTGFFSSLTPGNFSGDELPHLDFEIAISGPVVETTGT